MVVISIYGQATLWYLTFLAHLISNQMCYCYQKLDIWKISWADRSAPAGSAHLLSILSLWLAQTDHMTWNEGTGPLPGADPVILANQRLRIESKWGDQSAPESGPPVPSSQSHVISLSQSEPEDGECKGPLLGGTSPLMGADRSAIGRGPVRCREGIGHLPHSFSKSNRSDVP